jgi:hypothetical protein
MRVLLLDEGFNSGMVTARGLRRAGCAVDVVAATGGHGQCAVSDSVWRLAPRVDDARLMTVVDGMVRQHAYDVIYPITEPFQWLLWNVRPAWAARVFPNVEHHLRADRRDKRRMSEVVSRAGVSIPRQLRADTDADLRLAVRQLGLPIVVKGSHGRGGNATHICSSMAAAAAAVRELRQRGARPFAQAYIQGTTYLAGGLFDRGLPLRFYAGAKTVQFPPRVGPAAEIVSVDDPALTNTAIRIFGAASVTGLASIDLVRDAGGTYHFLELNPRPWGSIGAARDANVDLFGALVELWQRGTVRPRLEFRPGVPTAVFPLYLLAANYWRSGRASRALLSDSRRVLSMAREESTLASHVMHRLLRVGLNW